MLVTQRYKLEYYPEDQIVRLFDLENDPKEDTNQSENRSMQASGRTGERCYCGEQT